jgi:two-component system response regulator AtoC
VAHFAAENGRPTLRLTQDALCELEAQRWPGNVRELQNLMESLVVLADGPVLDASAVRTALERRFGATESTRPPANGGLAPTLDDARLRAEREAVVRALDRAGGNRAKAARMLGVSRRTLYNKLAEYGLS